MYCIFVFFLRNQEEREDQRAIQQAAKKFGQAVPNGSSVVLYDFANLEDYQEVEDGDVENISTTSSKQSRIPLLKRITGSKGGDKLRCVRMLSTSKPPGEEQEKGGVDGSGDEEDDVVQWAELPTVAVVLESIGKVVKSDAFVSRVTLFCFSSSFLWLFCVLVPV